MSKRFFACKMLLSCLCVIALFAGCKKGGDTKKPIILNPPASVSASDGLYDDEILITWPSVDSAASYNVYRCATADGTFELIGDSDSASYSDSTVAFQTQYFYKVSTVSSTDTEGDKTANADSGYADVAAAITLSASRDQLDRVSLTWAAPAAGTYTYNVLKSNSMTGAYTQIAGPLNSPNYDDMSVTPGTEYYYKVQSVSAMSSATAESNMPSGYALLAPPTAVLASDGTSELHVEITWSMIANAGACAIYRSPAADGTYTLIKDSATGTSFYDISDEVRGANAATAFFYKIAYVSVGGIEGVQSTVYDSGYVALNVPGGVAASDGKYYDSVKVTWTAVPNATSYKVYRDGILAGNSTTTSYSDTAATTYVSAYTVKAVKNGYETAASTADNGNCKDAATNQTFTINWTANKEAAVNRTGGGYKVYYSKNANFSGASTKSVPYVSGSAAPVTTTLDFTSADADKGTWYVKVAAYSNIGSAESAASSVITLVVE